MQNLERHEPTDPLVQIGELVQHITGGPVMAVHDLSIEVYDYELDRETDLYQCRWFDKNDVLRVETFRAMELRNADTTKTTED